LSLAGIFLVYFIWSIFGNGDGIFGNVKRIFGNQNAVFGNVMGGYD